MIVHELTQSEAHPVYQVLQQSNGNRQYDFLKSAVIAGLSLQRDFLSHDVIKAMNFHAIACLHVFAGEFRPCTVTVGQGHEMYSPPMPFQVQALMDDFVNTVNRRWDEADPVALAAFVLWRLNAIHPFINGNGRTARAASYFVLCLKLAQWLPGATILPELIRRDRAEYVLALKAADFSGGTDLTKLHALLTRLLQEQLAAVSAAPPAAPPRRLTRAMARARVAARRAP